MPSKNGVEGTAISPALMYPNGPSAPGQGILSRAKSAFNYLINGADTAWFGPQQPLQPLAQEAAGRVYDYMFGQNLIYEPKQGRDEGISFMQLRLAAEGCDIVRMCIETRKDQMAKLDWQIKPKDDDLEPDNRCKQLTQFFQKPDREHNWLQWQSLILDDHLTIDAATLYVRRTRAGGIYAFEPMDGSLIKRLINADGATPDYPDPAYQQILKGMPAVDYNTDDILYRPRYISTNKLYGRSPVEQAIITINLAINRELSRLDFYTTGTIPEGFLIGPPDWTPQQLQDFQTSFNSAMAGNLAKRRQAPVIPHGMSYEGIKTEQLKDELDEWIARKVCFVFSLPPTAFIKQMNRATAQSSAETAADEGIEPLKDWFRITIMNEIIQNYMGYDDLEFSWVEEEEADPMVSAQIDTMLVDKGLLSANEVRMDRGYDPVEGGDLPMLATPTGFVPLTSYQDQMAQQEVQNEQAKASAEAMANRPIVQADGSQQQSGSKTSPKNEAGGKKPNAQQKDQVAEKLKKKRATKSFYGTRHRH